MSERREASPPKDSREIRYMTEGLHLEDRENPFQNGAWKEMAILVGGLIIAAAVAWGVVRATSSRMISDRLSWTPTPVPQGIESTPPIGDFLGRGSQRWYVKER